MELLVDNMTARRAARMRYAKTFLINAAAAQLDKALKEYDIYIESVKYVPSLVNPADQPSRLPGWSTLRGEWGCGRQVIGPQTSKFPPHGKSEHVWKNRQNTHGRQVKASLLSGRCQIWKATKRALYLIWSGEAKKTTKETKYGAEG